MIKFNAILLYLQQGFRGFGVALGKIILKFIWWGL